jgi:hypothetical protein
MTFTLEEAKLELADEYERTGQLVIGLWLDRLPEAAAELLAFAFALEGSPRSAELLGGGEWIDEGAVAERALASACSRVEEPSAIAERRLGKEMAAIRAYPPPPQTGKAQPPFKRAAINAWVVDRLRGDQPGTSRISAQKTTYLLERSLGLGLFTEHQRMPFGPYDPTAKYKDAEPIGLKQGWITFSGYDLLAGPKIGAVYRFAPNYLRSADVAERLVRLLAERSPWELETWATVEAAAADLAASGQPVDAPSVRAALARIPAWEAKLKRRNFSIQAIQDALEHLVRLGLVQA